MGYAGSGTLKSEVQHHAKVPKLQTFHFWGRGEGWGGGGKAALGQSGLKQPYLALMFLYTLSAGCLTVGSIAD